MKSYLGGAGAGDFTLGLFSVGFTVDLASGLVTSGLWEGDSPAGLGAIAGFGAILGFSSVTVSSVVSIFEADTGVLGILGLATINLTVPEAVLSTLAAVL